MNAVIVDDHLLRDILAEQVSTELSDLLAQADTYTTNLWYLRLCRGVASSAGGQLTGGLGPVRRRGLGRALTSLPSYIRVVPFAQLAWRMAERHAEHALSTLSCEALVAAEHLDASIAVWERDDGPHLRAACSTAGIGYRTLG